LLLIIEIWVDWSITINQIKMLNGLAIENHVLAKITLRVWVECQKIEKFEALVSQKMLFQKFHAHSKGY